MKYKIPSLVLLLALLACNSDKGIPINIYSDSPQFIKNYLDSGSQYGTYLIAEQGQPWNDGKDAIDTSLPTIQFKTAILYDREFEMKLIEWGNRNRTLKIQFEGTKITGRKLE